MSTRKDVLKWLHDNLSTILSFPVPEDLTEYLLTIENDRDIEEYLRTMLDYAEPSHRQFVQNFKQIRHGAGLFQYNKEEDLHYGGIEKKKKKIIVKAEGITDSKLLKENITPNTINFDSQGKKDGSSKKKTKYVNLYSPEGEGRDVILLRGRHHCDCQATKHRLINNCLKCGRIVCAQEGSGPCIFCSSLVCSKEEQEFINTNTKQSEKLYDNLMSAGKPQGWEKAVEQRDRLLEYDRTSQRRTKVIDDEGEYFSSTSVWLSDSERKRMAMKEEEARSRKHASRLDRKVTLDFAGRQIREETEEEYGEEFYEDAMDKVNEALASSYIHPDDIRPGELPVFTEPGRGVARPTPRQQDVAWSSADVHRVQDKQLLEMTDSGACLSLHQPWASLLVAGIMRHEGRTWYSSHRGRLWIAAASKVPTDEEIKTCEHFYIVRNTGERIYFPSPYPTSCLLGCVTVTDCLPQEEYRQRFPDGESESPFVFICEDPTELSLRFPVSGRHKIYKLDGKIHQAAVKALSRGVKDSAR